MKDIRRKIFLFLEKLSFLQLFLCFAIIVVVFGYCYFALTPGGNGIRTTIEETFDIWNGMYFSVVTISSLGYGDMQPLGLSRFLSAIEVLLGLSLMGMLVAKLTSSRLSYHVKRLYISDSHRQLYEFQSKIRSTLSEINKLIQVFSPTFFETPRIKENIPKDVYQLNLGRARRSFANSFSELNKLIGELRSYINTEVGNGDFFSDISTDTIKDMGNYISEFSNLSYQFLIGIPEAKRPNLLYGEVGKNYNNSLNQIMGLCELVTKHSKDNQLKLLYSTIESVCSKSKNEIIIVSIAIYEINPPDQKIGGSVEPQTNQD